MLAAGRRTGSGDLFRHDQPQHQRRLRHRQCASLSRTAVAWLALCCIGSCSASAGDRDPAFQWCVSNCAGGDGCVMLPPAVSKHAAAECTAACPAQFDHPVPQALRLLRWSCEDDCRYRCMQARETLRREAHTADAALPAVVKYHGKWPFTRILGMQEVASVLFSLANMAAHIHCLLRFVSLLRRLAAGSSPDSSRGSRRSGGAGSAADTKGALQHFGGGDSAAVNDGGYSLDRPGSPQRTVFSKQPAGPRSSGGGSVASRLGVSSADSEGSAGSAGGSASRSTRLSLAQLRAAYPFYPLWLVYAATAIAAWAASAAFHARDVKFTERTDYLLADALVLFGLVVAATRALGWTRWRQWAALAAAGGGTFAYHAHHMLFVLFDYGWNVTLCVGVGLAQTITWAVWAARVRHPDRHQLYSFLLLLNAATLLEVLDFPPLLGLLDAHATWHAATVPLTYRFWGFVMGDARWCAERTTAAAAAEA